MDLRLKRYIKIYERDLRRIEEAFELYERNKGSKELDTEMIEDVLMDWEELIETLKDENEDFDELANEIFEKIEEFQTMLHDYEKARARYEESQAVNEAGERLSKSAIEHYLQQQAEASKKPLEPGRYDKALSRVSNPKDENKKPKNRLELDES